MKHPILSLCVLATLISVAGCKHGEPAYTVILIDVSKSITPDGVNYEFKSANDLVDRMKRGDHLTLIPITGNALADTSGHILRFDAPTQRQPYDRDLVVFRSKAHEHIGALRIAVLGQPAIRTDILGTLDLAKAEFAARGGDSSESSQARTLVIFSDFIEDDDIRRFVSDPALASSDTARALANQVRAGDGFDLGDTHVRLNTVESLDLRRLNSEREKAIRAFWQAYIPRSSWDIL